MKKRDNFIIVIPTVIVGVVIFIALMIYLFLKSSLPKVAGEIYISEESSVSIDKNVKVVSDNWGIPHIYAKNENDAYFVLGYKMAGDRLFQMELYRRLSSGTLSEIFGKDTLPLDIMFRSVGFKHYANQWYQKQFGSMNPQMLAGLLHFFEGVNYFIENERLPYEFTLLGITPTKFTPEDAFAFIGYMGFRFAIGIKQDLLFSKLSKKLPPEMFDVLRNSNEKSSKLSQISADILKSLQSFEKKYQLALPALEGSNAWVLSPSKSKSGGAILASDPHIGYSLPGIWYEAHIDTPSYKMYGHFLPLLPFPILGHNLDYGWAITISFLDDMDLYLEKLSPSKEEAMFKGQWYPLKKYPQTIKIKGEKALNFDLLISFHGPLLNMVFPDDNLALKWTFYNDDNTTMDALYRMGRAQGLEDFKSAVALGVSPGLNVLYADKRGEIGHWIFGAFPVRAKSASGDMVLNGESGEDEYLRYLDFKERPSKQNPASGIIVSANNNPQKENKALYGYWSSDDRYLSIEKRLMAQEKWSLEELKEVQTSNENAVIADKVDLLLSAIREKDTLPETSHYNFIIEMLQHWDQKSSVDSVPATIYHLTERESIRLILDELDSPLEKSENLTSYCTFDVREFFYSNILKVPDSPWWDIKATSPIEKRNDILRLAFKQTIDHLSSQWGDDLKTWKWGRIHTLELIHPIGRKWPFNYIFNIGPVAIPGGYNQINNNRDMGCSYDLRVESGPSTRRLVDFAYAETSYGVLPLGISGHILSDHYRDQLTLFLNGQYRYQLMGASAIEKNKESEVIFKKN